MSDVSCVLLTEMEIGYDCGEIEWIEEMDVGCVCPLAVAVEGLKLLLSHNALSSPSHIRRHLRKLVKTKT